LESWFSGSCTTWRPHLADFRFLATVILAQSPNTRTKISNVASNPIFVNCSVPHGAKTTTIHAKKKKCPSPSPIATNAPGTCCAQGLESNYAHRPTALGAASSTHKNKHKTHHPHANTAWQPKSPMPHLQVPLPILSLPPQGHKQYCNSNHATECSRFPRSQRHTFRISDAEISSPLAVASTVPPSVSILTR
jgi:hypothetical protein